MTVGMSGTLGARELRSEPASRHGDPAGPRSGPGAGFGAELGIDPAVKRLVVVKSTQHFRSGFDAMAAAVVYADTPGSLASDLGRLPYRYLPRPVWPLDRAC